MTSWRLVHVAPKGDLVEHECGEDEGCVCGPATQPVRDEAGVAWLVIHHALDGRELTERPGGALDPGGR